MATKKNKAPAKVKYVTGYKVVRHDMRSIHDSNFIYQIGQEAKALNLKASGGACGTGIHFSSNLNYPLKFSGYDLDEGSEKEFFSLFKVLKLRINPKDIVHKGFEKSRAKKVFVVSEVKNLNRPDYKPLIKRMRKISKTSFLKKCSTGIDSLKKSFTAFTQKNKLKGFEAKIITSPYEVLWIGNQLSSMRFGKLLQINALSVSSTFDDFYFEQQFILHEDYPNINYNFADSMHWIFANAAGRMSDELGAHNVEDLLLMLEAGAVPLGMSKGIVCWFAPQTVPNKWFPVL